MTDGYRRVSTLEKTVPKMVGILQITIGLHGGTTKKFLSEIPERVRRSEFKRPFSKKFPCKSLPVKLTKPSFYVDFQMRPKNRKLSKNFESKDRKSM